MTTPSQALSNHPHRLSHLVALTAETLVAADGSIWSHGATLGTRFKGSEFTIDEATIQNFVRVFATGYPQKIPVDYEHGTTNGATSFGQPVPKSGDVLELRGVFAPADFTGELLTAAQNLAERAGRPLEDPRNLGLWLRWKPTKRALGMIRDGEYSELSIAFDEDLPNNTTGEGQGPALIAVALTNLPFLDDMLPVAATRDGITPASPDNPRHKDKTMTTKLTLLSVAAAMLAKPLTDEDHAVTELTAFSNEVRSVREFSAIVGGELGETDPVKAVAAVRQLKATVTELTAKSTKELKARIATDVEAFLTANEKRIASVPLRAMLSRQLTGELEAKPETPIKDTETAKTIESMPIAGNTTQATGADAGAGTTEEQAVVAKAEELKTTDAEVKALMATNPNAGNLRALSKAAQLLQRK